MADDDGRCGVAVAVILRAGRQNNQDFSAKITKICAKITKNMNGVILVFCSVYRPELISQKAPGFLTPIVIGAHSASYSI